MIVRGEVPDWMRVEHNDAVWIRGEHTVLSQYGDRHGGFRNRPRFERGEKEVSMAEGHLSAVEVFRGMMGRPPKAEKGPKVRWFRLHDIMRQWYAGYSTPSAHNPRHVSVIALDIDARDTPRAMDAIQHAWDDDRRRPLSELAFGEGI